MPFSFLVTVEHASLPSTSESGVVLVTGAGDVGQLGLGPDVMEKTRFTVVNLDHEIVDVCAGGVHTVCLTKDGKVSRCRLLFASPTNPTFLGFNFWL